MPARLNARGFMGYTLKGWLRSVRELSGQGARPGGLAVRFALAKINFGTALMELIKRPSPKDILVV